MDSILTALAAYLIVGFSMASGYLYHSGFVAGKPGRWWRIPTALAFGTLVIPIAYLIDEGGKHAR